MKCIEEQDSTGRVALAIREPVQRFSLTPVVV